MNFFQLINLCLLEVNYKTENYFENLTKPDHIKFKNFLNRVNSEICLSDNWNFRRMKADFPINANQKEYEITFNGKIAKIFDDKTELEFNPDYTLIYLDKTNSSGYSVFNDKLLISAPKNTTLTVYYYKDDCAASHEGVSKPYMEFQEDVSILPNEFVEPLLVYGACLRFKSATSHPKYSFWTAEFLKAYRNLRSNALMTEAYKPSLRLSDRRGY